jgi:hypothetical protein
MSDADNENLTDVMRTLFTASETELDIIDHASHHPYVLHMARYIMPGAVAGVDHSHSLNVQHMNKEVREFVMAKFPLTADQTELAIASAIAVQGLRERTSGQA